MEELDNIIIDKVLNDPKLLALLKIPKNKDKEKTRVGLRFLQVPTIKFPKDDTKDYPPNLSVKIPVNFSSGKFTTEFYSKTKEKMDVNHDNVETLCPKKSEVKCLLRIASIWFVGGKFGCALRAEQVVVYPSQSLSGFAFVDDSDDEEEENEKPASGAVLSDTEDEDEAEDEVEAEVEAEDEDEDEDEDEVEVEAEKEVAENEPVLSDDSEEEEVVEPEPEPVKPKRGRKKKATTTRKR